MLQNKHTLVVGASPNPFRYSYKATSMLLSYGHKVSLFGIKKGEIEGISIRSELPAEQIDTITLYIGPQLQPQYYEMLLALQPKRIIFNPGTENPEFEQMAEARGIEALEACTLVMLQTNQY